MAKIYKCMNKSDLLDLQKELKVPISGIENYNDKWNIVVYFNYYYTKDAILTKKETVKSIMGDDVPIITYKSTLSIEELLERRQTDGNLSL